MKKHEQIQIVIEKINIIAEKYSKEARTMEVKDDNLFYKLKKVDELEAAKKTMQDNLCFSVDGIKVAEYFDGNLFFKKEAVIFKEDMPAFLAWVALMNEEI